jgi:tetratricopeptide (TPR) repeat protein
MNTDQWRHNDNRNWAGDHRGYGNDYWRHNNEWWHDHGRNWVGWWQLGVGWPWYGVGWGPYYGGYGYYGYGYPYVGDYYGYSGDAYGAYDYPVEGTPYTAAYAPDQTTAASSGDTGEFYDQAIEAFHGGDYRNAVRLAGHASIDDPRNPDVHLLLSLGLFAMGEYRGAAMEAHAVASLGKTPDWAKVYEIYGNADTYTDQLRALEKYVRTNPKSAEARFVLGFQYLVTGHPETARDQFLASLKLAPKDRIAAQLLKESGGTVPDDIAKQVQSPPPPPTNEPQK